MLFPASANTKYIIVTFVVLYSNLFTADRDFIVCLCMFCNCL